MTNKRKIALLGLLFDDNLGDPLLFDCAEYLVRKEYAGEVNVKCIDFVNPISEKKKSSKKVAAAKPNKIKKGIKTVLRTTLGEKNLSVILQNRIFKHSKEFLSARYEKELQDVDLIIIMGAGTLKYHVRYDFGPYYGLVCDYAQKYGIPIVVNCAGIESKYDKKDFRCRRFSRILSANPYKIITTRDEIDELRKYIKNPKIEIAKIADVGTWASEAFAIERDLNSDTIGIGVIAAERFVEYKRGISIEQYEAEIVRIVQQLEDRGEKWKLFTNGCTADSITAVNICKRLGKEPEAILLVPTTPRELVETVSKFKGIITSHLHSCIVAYSLNIPFIAVSWNNKLKYFAENIHCPERVVTAENFEAEYVISQFDEAMEKGYDLAHKELYRQSDIDYMKKYLALIDE